MVELTSRLMPNSEEVAAKVIEGEAIIINLTTGMYFSLDGAGALAWESLARGRSVEQVATDLTRRYQVSAVQAEADVIQLAGEFVSEGLMRPSPDGAAASPADPSVPAIPSEQSFPYLPPRLNKYADMADLLALDPPMPGLSRSPWAEPAEER